MGAVRTRRSNTEPVSKKEPSSRRLGEPPVLLALAAILAGTVTLALLFVPRPPEASSTVVDPPGADSPEAGFARDMSVHHAQAVSMAQTVRDRTEDPAIRILANDMILTQQAEIGQMRGWLEAWGLPAGETGPAMAWMGHPQDAGTMPGMASPEDLARLQQASSEEADEQFLRLMIPHHQAAVEMAQAAQQLSDRPEVVRFAQKTSLSQQTEIRGMQGLLQRKGFDPVEVEPFFAPANGAENHGEEGHDAEHAGAARGDEAYSSTVYDTARLAALPLAVLAATWLGLDALRRRRDGVGGFVSSSPAFFWRAVAVGGLVVSAALHFGLAPTYFGEAISQGVFFSVTGVVLAAVAAAVLAWPSRLAYVAGIGISVALIALWAVFRVLPPPGAEAAESVDLAGLLTKAMELAAATACAVLWFRSRRVHRTE